MTANNRIEDSERTNAVGLFNTARSYWRSAEHLNAAQVKVTHPHAPVTFLFCHAIELYLKAFLRAKECSLSELRSWGHNIANLSDAAHQRGLLLEAATREILSHISDADVPIEARYIVTGFKSLPSYEALSNSSQELDHRICDSLQTLGLSVRKENFEKPSRQETPLAALLPVDGNISAAEPANQAQTLSDEAIQLLLEATLDKSGTIINFSSVSGRSIRCNGKTFGDSNDRRAVARWEHALRQLFVKGLVVSRGTKHEIFEVTELGYQLADTVRGQGRARN